MTARLHTTGPVPAFSWTEAWRSLDELGLDERLTRGPLDPGVTVGALQVELLYGRVSPQVVAAYLVGSGRRVVVSGDAA